MYTRCTIQFADDNTEMQDVIIKSTDEVIEGEDDYIFFYGLSPEFLKYALDNRIILENEWRVKEINGVYTTL